MWWQKKTAGRKREEGKAASPCALLLSLSLTLFSRLGGSLVLRLFWLIAGSQYQHLVHDLEERLRGFVGAASRLAQMGESMAASADKVCYTSGLSENSGKSIDCDPMKAVVEGFKERCERVRADIALLDEEIKTLIGHVDERNKAGAHYEKERGKAEKLEGKHDAVSSSLCVSNGADWCKKIRKRPWRGQRPTGRATRIGRCTTGH